MVDTLMKARTIVPLGDPFGTAFARSQEAQRTYEEMGRAGEKRYERAKELAEIRWKAQPRPEPSYAGLSSEEIRLLQEKGSQALTSYRQQRFEEANIELDTGEYVPRMAYENLTQEQKEILRTRGIEGYEEWAGEEKAKFLKGAVEVRSGEYVERGWYEGELTPELQKQLKATGVKEFGIWIEGKEADYKAFVAAHVEVSPDVWLTKADWKGISTEDRTRIKTIGYEPWIAEEKEGIKTFKATHIEVAPDVWIGKDTPPEVVSRIRKIGYGAYVEEVEAQGEVFEKLEPYKEQVINKDIFGRVSAIQPIEDKYTYDIGQAQLDKAVTPKELEFVGYEFGDIEETRVRTEVGWKAWLPIYSTVKLWNVAPGWEKALMLGSDVLLFLPMIGGVAKGATAVTRAATVGGRAATVGRSFARMGLEVAKFPFRVVGGVGSAIRHPIMATRSIPSGLRGVAGATFYPIRHPVLTAKAWGGILTGTRALPGPTLSEFARLASVQKVKVPIKLGYQLPGDIPVLDDAGRIVRYQRTVWKGFTVGERPVYPRVTKTLGVTAKEIAPWIPKTPLETRVTMRGLTTQETKFLRRVGTSLGLTGQEIGAIKKAGIPKISGFAPRELAKYPTVVPEVRRFIGWRSPYGERLLKYPTVKGLTAESVATIYDEAARYSVRTGRNVVPFGSGIASQQMPSGLGRLPADLDILFYSPKSEVDDWARLTAKKITSLGHNKVKAIITPTEVNLQAWDDVAGRWIRVTDLKYMPDVETLRYMGPEYAFGIKLEEPLVKFKTISGRTLRGWSLSQQAKVKGLGSLAAGWEAGRVGPEVGRIKDITDFIDYVRARGDIGAAGAISKLYGLSLDDIATRGARIPLVRFGPSPVESIFSRGVSVVGGLSSVIGPIPSPGVFMSPVLPRSISSLASPLAPVSSLSQIPSLSSTFRKVETYKPISPLLPSTMVGWDYAAISGVSKVPPISDFKVSSPISKYSPSIPKYGLPSPEVKVSYYDHPSVSRTPFLVSPRAGFPSRIFPGGPSPTYPSRLPSPGYPPVVPPGYPYIPPFGYPGMPPPEVPPKVPPAYPPRYIPPRWFGGDKKKKRKKPPPEIVAEWQQGFIKKTVLAGEDKPVSEYNPVPKGAGKPSRTYRYRYEGEPVPGDVDLGVTDIAFDEEMIRFSGGGLETDVGKRLPSKTKGWSARKKVEEGQFVRV